MKLILVIGKKIQRLNQFSLIVNTGDGQCSEAIKFPEIEHGAPMHVDDVLERFYAISLDRKLKHPAVVAISEAAKARLGD